MTFLSQGCGWCFQLSWVMRETSDFEPYLPVSRLEPEISQIITKVCLFLVDATLWHEISNILCCLSYFINIEHFRLNSGIPLKYKQQHDWQVNNMVASKPIRSNVTIPTTSFGEMMSWAVHYDMIYHFSIFEDLRGWQPCVESHFVFKETNMQSEHVVLKILGLGFLAYSVRFPCLRADLAVHVIAIFFVNHPLTFSARAWIIFSPWI